MSRKIALLALAGTSILGVQAASSVWDGVYTAEQAKSGESLYAKNCASCHGKALEGAGQAPPLAGSEFLMHWNGATVGELFEKMQTSMPADRPGALSPTGTAAILAFILKSSGFPAGAQALPADASELRQIRFEPARAK